MTNICLTCPHRKVLKSAAGYYIGATLEHKPYCRVSDYFTDKALAKSALKDGFIYRDCIENYLVRKAYGFEIKKEYIDGFNNKLKANMQTTIFNKPKQKYNQNLVMAGVNK